MTQKFSAPLGADERAPIRNRRGWPRTLLVAGSLYGVWLAWLAYVASVNIGAGNQ